MTLTITGIVLGTVAAVCFYVSALAPIGNRERAVVAVLGIVTDWIPVLVGWMSISGSPSRVLYAAHLGFGVVGYALLVYCLAAWLRDRNPRLAIRLAFLGIWTVAFLAGVAMASAALS